ncbi:MAG: hypothetical protein M1827_000893 [Pycnora praestabilis]|nr:MAG: hypothetical protein M1827_000893 [Pycnora praestabilis]
MAPFASLPPELTREVLSYLPIPTLLSFGQTSHNNHLIQTISLSALRLGIFHTRINGLISFMESPTSSQLLAIHSVPIVLKKRASHDKYQIIRNQNSTTRHILTQYSRTLRDLELVLWDLDEGTAKILANMKNLRRLSLRFDHPHTRHVRLPRGYWDESPGSTIWNHFDVDDGTGKGEKAFGRLETLTLERSGITDYQLQRILVNNPRIKELRLQKCLNLTEETFEFIASHSPLNQTLETLHFTKSNNHDIDERVLKHIGRLSNLKSLSLHGCPHLENETIKPLNEQSWHIPDLMLPQGPDSPREAGQGIEVDPAYK